MEEKQKNIIIIFSLSTNPEHVVLIFLIGNRFKAKMYGEIH